MVKLGVDPADVNPSIANVVIIGISAIVFIVVFKVLMQRLPIPGLAHVANMI